MFLNPRLHYASLSGNDNPPLFFRAFDNAAISYSCALTAQRFLLLRASEYAATTSSSRASDNVAIDVHAGQRRQPLILKKVNGLYAKDTIRQRY